MKTVVLSLRVALIVAIPFFVCFVVIFFVVFVFFVWPFSNEDIDGHGAISTGFMEVFWTYAAHAQWYAVPVGNRCKNETGAGGSTLLCRF